MFLFNCNKPGLYYSINALITIMSQDNLITLHCKKTGEHVTTRKNKKKLANAPKLTLKKYSKKLKKRVTFVETKKMFKKK